MSKDEDIGIITVDASLNAKKSSFGQQESSSRALKCVCVCARVQNGAMGLYKYVLLFYPLVSSSV